MLCVSCPRSSSCLTQGKVELDRFELADKMRYFYSSQSDVERFEYFEVHFCEVSWEVVCLQALFEVIS